MAPLHTPESQYLSPASQTQPDNDFLPSPLSLNSNEIRLPHDNQDETRLQQCWDESIAKHMDLPDGYRNVHVLMIKWEDQIDQLNVRGEVDELTGVFKDVFNYQMTKVQLGAKNSQLQLESAVSTWAYQYDGPDNLLIVYYAGHGIFHRQDKILEFAATNVAEGGPRAVWNRAEVHFLQTVRADVFAILDCCYASDLCRNVPENGRTYEFLAASPIGVTTSAPGEHSFTRCLIKQLKDLAAQSAEGSFTTRDLHERLQKERKDEPPALWRRFPWSSRHIRLKKVNHPNENSKKGYAIPTSARFLRLDFALKNELFTEVHIDRLTKQLPKLFQDAKVPVLDIRWLSCEKTGRPPFTSFKEVAQHVLKHRRKLTDLYSLTKTKRKRNADEAGLDDVTTGAEDRQRHLNPKLLVASPL